MTHQGGPVRVGVAGCGSIACWIHLRTLRRLPSARLVAAADPDPKARARAAPFVSSHRVHSDVAGLLTDDVDAIVICAPNEFHAGLTIAAARSGKHVYVEKPLATTAEEARAVLTDVAQSNIVAAVGFNFRHHPAHQRARTLLRERRIGAVRAVKTVFCEPLSGDRMPSWKRRRASGGGAPLDLASHHIDLLRWFLDDEVAMVRATIASIRTEHDNATLSLTMRSGVEVQMHVSFVEGPADHLEFIGERGTIRVDRRSLMPTLSRPRASGDGMWSSWQLPGLEITGLWARRLVQRSHQPSFGRALGAFVQRIGGAAAPIATLEDGERSLAVVLAAEESARLNDVVRLA